MAVKIQFVNEMTKDIKTLEAGLDIPGFFSVFIWGVPHFIRKMWGWAGAMVAVNLLTWILTASAADGGDDAVVGMIIISLLICVGTGVYVALRGQAAYAKHLLNDGYIFREADTDEVKFAKEKWGIL